MSKVVVRHKVKDIDAWLQGHMERVALFAPAVSNFETFQDADDPNSVVLVIEVNDLEKLGAIINDPANAGLKTKHTVLDPIIMSTQVAL
ncbi:MAG: hypothetical protein ABI416_04510 [Ginsengibacter sp.]